MITSNFIRNIARVCIAVILGTACVQPNRAAPPEPVAPVATAHAGHAPAGTDNQVAGADTGAIADAHFLIGMIAHHSQAITMSRMAATNGAAAQVRTLADRIINGQEDEIAAMQRWLRDRNIPHTKAHDMQMPGMVSDSRMRELQAATGKNFDRLFLTYMIRHHRGAITMVNNLLNAEGAAQDQTIFKIASDVSADQTTEIERMQLMLQAIGSTPR